MAALVKAVIHELKQAGDPQRAEHSRRFFKTGPGEYGAGDRFLGVRVPQQRAIARKFKQATREEILELLQSPDHEVRLTALFMLVHLYGRAHPAGQEQIYQGYLAHVAHINNWDLVDSSAHQIVGQHLYDKDRSVLIRLARSPNLWERRISIIATHYFIRRDDFQDTLKISQVLLNDPEDLIHKAVGWMLREVGKRNPDVEEAFLKDHYQQMPRTMLRYAIEKLPGERRQAYLKGKI